MRKAHVIQDTKGNEYPQHIVFIDTETSTVPRGNGRSELTLNFGVACYWRPVRSDRGQPEKWHTFKTKRDVWRFIESHAYSGQKLYVVAHNVAFDWKVIDGFGQAKRNGWTLKKLITIGTRNIWHFRKDRKSLMVLDNMNFFSSSLESLGESIGIPKLKMPSDDAPFTEWETYCKRDVRVMLEAWKSWRSFLVENDLGNFGKTLASQAFNAYRHRFMPAKLYVHTNEKVVSLEREAYHGGRTEAFFIGALPLADYYYLDVVSMYPAEMRENEYPTKLIEVRQNVSIHDLQNLLRSRCVIARCELVSDENVYPLVKDGRLIFPIGSFETVLSSRELDYAIEKHHISAIHECAIYERAKVFEEYVDFFHAARQRYKSEGNTAFAYASKLLLNTLYGKFGQRQDVWKHIGDYPTPETQTWTEWYEGDKKYHTYRLLNGRLEERVGLEEGFNSMVSIAAHVTADARMKLWKYMQIIGLENCYYVDTDSIFTNHVGYRKAEVLIDPRRLGRLDVKGHSNELEIYGAKDYRFGVSRTLKGIRKDATYLGDNRYRQVRFQGLKGAWREGRLDRQVIDTVEKQLTRTYHKGNVTSAGRVMPFTVSNADSGQRVLQWDRDMGVSHPHHVADVLGAQEDPDKVA